MAIDWGAFVQGWAGSAADNIKEREKAEKIAQTLDTIENEELRAALGRLGASIKRG